MNVLCVLTHIRVSRIVVVSPNRLGGKRTGCRVNSQSSQKSIVSAHKTQDSAAIAVITTFNLEVDKVIIFHRTLECCVPSLASHGSNK